MLKEKSNSNHKEGGGRDTYEDGSRRDTGNWEETASPIRIIVYLVKLMAYRSIIEYS